MARSPVSVLMPVRNEEQNLRRSLPALTWADEIFVVDSQSSDRTVEVAESFGAKVVQFHLMTAGMEYAEKKNWALRNLGFRNEWLLIVDADEVITPELAAEIQDAVERDGVDGYYINRRFMFMGRWIKHCGYYPSWNLRLVKHGLAGCETVAVHEHVILNGKTGKLKNAMLHFAYPDLETWVEKHNRYSTLEARSILTGCGLDKKLTVRPQSPGLEMKRLLRRLSRIMPCRPTLRFVYHYILRCGFLDGREGLILCRLMGWYEYISKIKEMEMRRKLV